MERVRILLRTRNDPYPSPRSLSIPSTPSGPAPSRKRRCPTCDGRGRIRTTTVCPVCDGLKSIALDSYTGRVSGAETKNPEPMSPERVEAELGRLRTSLRLSEGEIDPNEAYGWERAVERRDRQGSYRELELALQALRAVDPRGLDFLLWIYGTGLDVELTAGARKVEERYIAALARVMPSKIRLPHHLARELAERKEELVLALNADNLDIEEIADTALVSVSTAKRILGAKKSQTVATIAS